MTNRKFSRRVPLLREERGVITLIEMVIVIPLMLVVLGGVYFLYQVSVREQTRGDARVRGLVHQKNGLERISRELRDAVAVKYKTSEVVDVQVTSGGNWLRYDCSGTACNRYEGPTEGTGFTKGPVPVVSGLHSAEFQTLASVDGTLQPDFVNPTYVSVTLKVTVPGATNPIVLSDGFNLRNLTNPG